MSKTLHITMPDNSTYRYYELIHFIIRVMDDQVTITSTNGDHSILVGNPVETLTRIIKSIGTLGAGAASDLKKVMGDDGYTRLLLDDKHVLLSTKDMFVAAVEALRKSLIKANTSYYAKTISIEAMVEGCLVVIADGVQHTLTTGVVGSSATIAKWMLGNLDDLGGAELVYTGIRIRIHPRLGRTDITLISFESKYSTVYVEVQYKSHEYSTLKRNLTQLI